MSQPLEICKCGCGKTNEAVSQWSAYVKKFTIIIVERRVKGQEMYCLDVVGRERCTCINQFESLSEAEKDIYKVMGEWVVHGWRVLSVGANSIEMVWTENKGQIKNRQKWRTFHTRKNKSISALGNPCIRSELRLINIQ